MTLYEAIKLTHSGLDICDNTFDYSTHIDFTETETGYPNDSYDAAMIAIAKRLETENIAPEYYSECDITEFLAKYENAFKTLMKEFLEFPPESYPTPKEEDDFYDVYIKTFDELTKGGWPTEAYTRLVELLNASEQDVSHDNEVTVEEITEKFGLTQLAFAAKIGIHSSLITKIKTGDAPITPNVQEKFQKEFPEFVLVNDHYRLTRAIEEFQATVKELTQLDQEYQIKRTSITNQINLLSKKIKELSKKVGMVNDTRSN